MTYKIYLGENLVAEVTGSDYAGSVWVKVLELAEMLETDCLFMSGETGEVFDCYNPNAFNPEPDYDECGFDPYEGCYTYDC